MIVVESFAAARRASTGTVGLVPTMGYLHEGHLACVAAVRAESDSVVMSIFVNPTQFGAGEDFGAYPRTLAADSALIEAAGTVDLLFVPDAAEVYPFGIEDAVRLQLPALSRELCGASRPAAR